MSTQCPDMVRAEVKKTLKAQRAARHSALKRRAQKYGMFAGQFMAEQIAKRPEYYNPKADDKVTQRAEAKVAEKIGVIPDWKYAIVEAEQTKPKDWERSDIKFWYHAAFYRDAVRRITTPLQFQLYQDNAGNYGKGLAQQADYWLQVRLKLREQRALAQDAPDFQAYLQHWFYASNTGRTVRRVKASSYEWRVYLAIAEVLETMPDKANRLATDKIVIAQNVRKVRAHWQKLGHTDGNIRQSILHEPVYPTKQHSLF